MFNDHRWGFDWTEFMTGIVFLIAAYFVIKQPQAALLSLVFLFAIAAIISGVTTIGGYTKLRRETGLRANFALVFAIIDILRTDWGTGTRLRLCLLVLDRFD